MLRSSELKNLCFIIDRMYRSISFVRNLLKYRIEE